jgi:flagellar motor switch protein FliN/FliY
MAGEITQREAITQLAASTAEAVARVLETFLADGVSRGDVTVLAPEQNPFGGLPPGGVAASIHYVDGVAGANVFIMPAAGARALAVAMGAGDHEEGALTELELSAIGEATNQMLASAAAAISVVIGQEIEISPPDVRVIDEKLEPVDAWGTAPHACVTSFAVAGHSCRLVQLVPNAFLVRMARAIDDLGMRQASVGLGPVLAGGVGGVDGVSGAGVPITEQLGRVGIRVWAELGRTRLPIGAAVTLPSGALVDLDRSVDSPVDLFVNGLCFGQGNLLVTDDGEWAIEVTALSRPSVRQPALVGGAGVMDRAGDGIAETS